MIHVTRHAIERYQQRVEPVDAETAEARIREAVERVGTLAPESSIGFWIKIGGVKFAMRSRTVITTYSEAKVMGRPGRKNVKRYPSGEIVKGQQGETPEQAMATVKAQRIKRVGRDHWRDQLAGTVLGELRLAGRQAERDGSTSQSMSGISADQYDAGEWFQSVKARKRRIDGTPSPNPRGIDLTRTFGGGDDRDYTREEANRITAEHDACIQALKEAGRELGQPNGPLSAVLMVCMENRIHTGAHRQQFFGCLRAGLNALHRLRMAGRFDAFGG